jgi:hypothetical protein
LKLGLSIYAICICTVFIAASCAKSDTDSVEDDNPTPVGIIDPALVGTWVGTVDGSFGTADMTMTLNEDGTVSAEGSTELYCPIVGTWEVLANKFQIKGKDDCDGTSVSMNAPYSKLRLAGSWSASSGNSGSFVVQKQ